MIFFDYNETIFYNLWILKKGDIFPKTKMDLVVFVRGSLAFFTPKPMIWKKRGCQKTAATPLDALNSYPKIALAAA